MTCLGWVLLVLCGVCEREGWGFKRGTYDGTAGEMSDFSGVSSLSRKVFSPPTKRRVAIVMMCVGVMDG